MASVTSASLIEGGKLEHFNSFKTADFGLTGSFEPFIYLFDDFCLPPIM
jgi:hypothetical protein